MNPRETRTFWTASDLAIKLSDFKRYYNGYPVHASLEGQTPIETPESKGVNLKSYPRQKHCRGCTKHQRLHEREFAIHRIKSNARTKPAATCPKTRAGMEQC